MRRGWKKATKESKRQEKKEKPLKFSYFSLSAADSIEIAQEEANVKVFNFFFMFLIDIKQIFSINN